MRALILLCVLSATASAGPIKGKITFKGDKAPEVGYDRSSDSYCASEPGRAYAFDVKDHKVAGAYVRIANGTFKTKATPPDDPVVITQSKCEYTPRVVGVIEGQKIEIRNDDPVFHNVRVIGTDGKLMLNKAQQKGADPITTDAIDDDGIVELHCDVHPWMESWAFVSDSTYFAVTGEDGSFSFTGLKPGKYSIEAWVPTLGWKTATVKVKKGKKAAKVEIRFDLDDCGGCGGG